MSGNDRPEPTSAGDLAVLARAQGAWVAFASVADDALQDAIARVQAAPTPAADAFLGRVVDALSPDDDPFWAGVAVQYASHPDTSPAVRDYLRRLLGRADLYPLLGGLLPGAGLYLGLLSVWPDVFLRDLFARAEALLKADPDDPEKQHDSRLLRRAAFQGCVAAGTDFACALAAGRRAAADGTTPTLAEAEAVISSWWRNRPQR